MIHVHDAFLGAGAHIGGRGCMYVNRAGSFGRGECWIYTLGAIYLLFMVLSGKCYVM